MENRKKVVFALFNSETCNLLELNNQVYEVYPIGINSSGIKIDSLINCDLSDYSCFKILDSLPKPDIIIAHPPCECWTTMNSAHNSRYTDEKGFYNLYWKRKWEPTDHNHIIRGKRINSCNTALMTSEIIMRYNPELWIVENPVMSWIFDYMAYFFGLYGYKNRLRYINYDHESCVKPTIFYSNIEMCLKNYNILKHKITIRKLKTYRERSMVPIESIKHALYFYENQILKLF